MSGTEGSAEPLVDMLGYDPGLFSRLDAPARSDIARACEGMTLSTCLLAAPAGYTAWLLSHALWAAALAALGLFAFVINLLRLSVSGAGRAPSDERAVVLAHRPSLTPLVLLGALALLFAQPAQLPFWRGELDPLIARERTKLVVDHAASLALRGETADDGYARELAECEFVVLRLCTLWQSAGSAAQLTLLYLALVLAPMLVTRTSGGRGLARYELLRWRDQRALVRVDARATHAHVHALLAGFEPSRRAQHDPFAPAPIDPLRSAWSEVAR